MMRMLVQNFVLFQLGWLACVLGGASAYPWVGSLVVAGIIGIHLAYAEQVKPELILILCAIVIGTLWDSVLTSMGMMQFSNGTLIEGLAPYWLIAMWALFATTLNVSLNWLKNRVVLSALLGLVGGPLAYYAGHRLGAVQFPEISDSLIIIGGGWAVIMPLLAWIASQYNGYRNSERLAS